MLPLTQTSPSAGEMEVSGGTSETMVHALEGRMPCTRLPTTIAVENSFALQEASPKTLLQMSNVVHREPAKDNLVSVLGLPGVKIRVKVRQFRGDSRSSTQFVYQVWFIVLSSALR